MNDRERKRLHLEVKILGRTDEFFWLRLQGTKIARPYRGKWSFPKSDEATARAEIARRPRQAGVLLAGPPARPPAPSSAFVLLFYGPVAELAGTCANSQPDRRYESDGIARRGSTPFGCKLAPPALAAT